MFEEENIPVYRDDALRDHVLLKANPRLQFLQHDSARPHTARERTSYLV